MKKVFIFIMQCLAGAMAIVVIFILSTQDKSDDMNDSTDCKQAAEYIQKSSDFTLTVKRVGKGYKDWKYTVYINENSVVETTSTKSECDAIKQIYPSIVLFNNSKEEVEDGE